MHILMVKECRLTGLKYLCKTSGKNADPYRYHGSGVRWINHLRKYYRQWTIPENVETTILGRYETKEELRKMGLYYSDLFNVVEDYNWANIVPEAGDGGWINDQTGKHWKVKDTTKMRNKKTQTKAVLEAHRKNSGAGNYQCPDMIITPWGEFECKRDAESPEAVQYAKENNIPYVSAGTIRTYVENLDTPLNKEGRRTPKAWRGKTPREIGFGLRKHE